MDLYSESKTRRIVFWCAIGIFVATLLFGYYSYLQLKEIKDRGLEMCLMFEQTVPLAENCSNYGGVFTFQCIPGWRAWTDIVKNHSSV